MADRIQQRRDTAARWAQYNPILLEGEVGYVTDDPNQYKIGDGVHTWNELPLRGFDGTLVHTIGNSQTSAMSQYGVSNLLINIVGMAADSETAGVKNIGDVFYNTDTKLLRRATSVDPIHVVETVPYVDGAIYSFNGELWQWNRNDLVQVTNKSSIFPSGEYSVVCLTGFGIDSARSGVTKLGDIYYNTNTKLLRKCTQYTNPYTGEFTTLEFEENTLYLNYSDNNIYKWNGEDMEYLFGESERMNQNRIFFLDNIGTSWKSTLVRLGSVYYNTEQKSIKKAVEKDQYGNISKSISIPLFYDALYYFNNELYQWNGNDLVSTSNENFAEITATISMQGGQISTNIGRPLGAIVQDYAFFNYYNQPNFLRIENGDKIVNVLLGDLELVGFGTLGTGLVTKLGDVYYNTNTKLLRKCIVFGDVEEYETVPFIDNGIYYNKQDGKYYEWDGSDMVEKTDGLETLNIHCYSDPVTYLGYVTVTDNNYALKEGTKLIKFEVSKNSAYAKGRSLQYSILYHASALEYVKNDIVERSTKEKYISYEIELPVITDEVSATLDYKGYNGTRAYNNGFLILPPNYSVYGDPVPLVIFFHGTEGYVFSEMQIQSYGELLKFIANNGYAVADCSALSSLYKDEYDGNGPTPLGFSCYCSLYNYIIRNYNIREDGVYIFGKSSGGILTELMSALWPFPIRAAGGLAPTCDIFANMLICLSRSTNFWLDQLGLPSPNVSDHLNGSGDKEYLLSNIDKFVGYNPMWINTEGIDFENLAQEILNTGLSTSDLEGNSDITSMINVAKKIQNVPYKIWHAVDDANVPIATSRFYQKMIKNAGGICYLRELPSGCGQHHAVDNASNAPKTSYQTKYGSKVDIPVAYAELVDWFNRW